MFPAPIISKLGLIPTDNPHEMYSTYHKFSLLDVDQEGNPLPEKIYMVSHTIKGITQVTFTNQSRILAGVGFEAYSN